MGSFNVSCFATHQTIAPSDPCRIFLVRDTSWLDNTSSAPTEFRSAHAETPRVFNSLGVEDRWTALGPSLRAHYADYGRFELAEEDVQAGKTLLRALYPHLSFASKGLYRSFSPSQMALNLEIDVHESWDMTMTAAQRNLLFCTSYDDSEPRQVKVAALHERAYGLISSVAVEFGDRPLDAVRLASRVVDAIETDRLGNSIPPIGAERNEWYVSLVYGLRGYRYEPIAGLWNRPLREAIDLYLTQWDSDGKTRLLAAATDALSNDMLLVGLSRLHLQMQPSGEGGQDDNNSVGLAYTQIVADVGASVSNRREKLSFLAARRVTKAT